jgi:hypothetical protein
MSLHPLHEYILVSFPFKGAVHFGNRNRGVLSDKLHRCCFGRLFQSPNFDAEVLGGHENGAVAGTKNRRRGVSLTLRLGFDRVFVGDETGRIMESLSLMTSS